MDGPDDGVQRLCCGMWNDRPHATGCSLSMADGRDALQSVWAHFENSNALKHATGWEFASTAFIAGYDAAERRADALAGQVQALIGNTEAMQGPWESLIDNESDPLPDDFDQDTIYKAFARGWECALVAVDNVFYAATAPDRGDGALGSTQRLSEKRLAELRKNAQEAVLCDSGSIRNNRHYGDSGPYCAGCTYIIEAHEILALLDALAAQATGEEA